MGFSAVMVLDCALTYLSGVAFYHASDQRAAANVPPDCLPALGPLAWLSLLAGFWIAVRTFGWQVGLMIQLFLCSALLLLSLLVATRWPLWHSRSGIAVALFIPVAFAL